MTSTAELCFALSTVLQQQLGGMTGSIGVPSVAAPSYGSASAAGAAYPASFASPSPCAPASALPPAQPFAHGFPQATPADDFSLKREKSALPELQVKGGDSASVTRTINEWLQKTALSLSMLGLHHGCNSGITQLLQLELLTNNGLIWLLLKEPCRQVSLLLLILCLCNFQSLTRP